MKAVGKEKLYNYQTILESFSSLRKKLETLPLLRGLTKTFSIAMISPMPHILLEALQEALITTMKNEKVSFNFDEYHLHGSSAEMTKKVNAINFDSYDLILTFGHSSTELVKNLFEKTNRSIPVVFCGVRNPVKTGLVKSMESSQSFLTGMASSSRTYGSDVAIMLHLKPHIKSVLLVHNNTEQHLQQEVDEASSILKKRGVGKVTVLGVSSLHDIINEVTPSLLEEYDVLFTLRDNLVGQHARVLSHLCSESGVLFFSSEYYSVENGAAVSFGAPVHEDGVQCAKKIIAILKNKTKPCDIPIQYPKDQPRLRINYQTMLKQGLALLDTSKLSKHQIIEK